MPPPQLSKWILDRRMHEAREQYRDKKAHGNVYFANQLNLRTTNIDSQLECMEALCLINPTRRQNIAYRSRKNRRFSSGR